MFSYLLFFVDQISWIEVFLSDRPLDEFVLLRSTVGWICSSQIYFSFGSFFSLIFLSTFTRLKKRFTLLFVFSFFYIVNIESFNLSLSIEIYQWTLTTPSLLAAKFQGFITVHSQEKVTFASSKAYLSVKR
ncbi:hypothetical protein DEO72_LG6g506 [Vigna unguiculata]|uniref:Uncharacterized protein n=1 Tax=Vigna unguiculata TaxID=3917 RepID=A0A4D6M529_VIGUN|nr:hypothetical protein DEO72_LG6g506 [Vigna unguiculata]